MENREIKLTREIELLEPTAARRQYEFNDNGSCIGQLCFKNILRTQATAEIDSRRWTITQTGVLRKKIVIRQFDSSVESGAFFANSGAYDGFLIPSGGSKISAHVSGWNSSIKFTDSYGDLLAEFSGHGKVRLSTKTENHDVNPTSHILLILGTFILALAKEQNALFTVIS